MIRYLLDEGGWDADVPDDECGQERLLRALVNVRPPRPIADEFLRVQDEYLQERLRARGVTDVAELTPIAPELYLWRGDITTLRCDAIVNAANAQMLGCFCPNHGCIDNAIHTFAGVQLRQACADIMRAQGRGEPTGRAKLTKAYNLPCRYTLEEYWAWWSRHVGCFSARPVATRKRTTTKRRFAAWSPNKRICGSRRT